MKNSNYLIILLAIALMAVSYKWISATSQAGASSEPIASSGSFALDNIMTRTSVRAYSERGVSEQQMDTLLKAAMAAPTAGNKQPWRFVVINDKKILKSIAEKFETMTMAEHAPVAVVACGDVTATFDGEGRDYWVQDVSAASENLLLAAHAMGLGAVWCGIYPLQERVKDFSTMLGLPENIVPMACICIGYPKGKSEPKDKWKPQNVRYNNWEVATSGTSH